MKSLALLLLLASASAQQPVPTISIPDSALSKSPTILVYGDTRFHDPTDTTPANPQARKLLVDRIAALHPDAVQVTGDIPYNGANPADYRNFALESAPWRAASLRIFPALGNHEFAGPHTPEALAQDLLNWRAAFPELPELRDHRWYSVALGSRLLLLQLDSTSDLLPGSPQLLWLAAQLHAAPRRVDFIFIALHHPPVADIQTRFEVDHNPRPNEIALRDLLSTIAPSLHARLIVSAGHIHNYERFQLRGVTYLVSGGGGAKPYPVDRTPPDLYQSPDFPNFHYVLFHLEGKHLTATMVRLQDPSAPTPTWQPRDTFTLTAR